MSGYSIVEFGNPPVRRSFTLEEAVEHWAARGYAVHISRPEGGNWHVGLQWGPHGEPYVAAGESLLAAFAQAHAGEERRSARELRWACGHATTESGLLPGPGPFQLEHSCPACHGADVARLMGEDGR